MVPIGKLVADTARITRKIMIYGGGKDDDLGVGKTTLAATAQDCPQMSDALLVDMDGGKTSVLSRGDLLGADLRKVDEVEKLLWQFAQKDESVKTVRTLILDGSSELQNQDLEDIATAAAEDPNARRKRDRDVNELLDYKKSKNRMLRILRMARDVSTNNGLNLVVTCWAKKVWPSKPGTDEPDYSQNPSITPDISKGVSAMLLGFLDDVWYLHADPKTRTRYLITDKHATDKGETIIAKTRDIAVAKQFTTTFGDKVLPVIVNPKFPDLYARYQAAYIKQ